MVGMEDEEARAKRDILGGHQDVIWRFLGAVSLVTGRREYKLMLM